MPVDLDQEKLLAARAAVSRVRFGMRVALGTGSTAAFAVRLLAEKFPRREEISAVASSQVTERLARDLRIPVGPIKPHESFDVMLDGADEVTPTLAMTKGGGGALLREKLLARLSRDRIIMVDHTKLVDRLGARWAIPIEIVPYARSVLIDQLAEQRIAAALRSTDGGETPFVTDNGNEILDLRLPEPLDDPSTLDALLRSMVGVVETGIFVGLASRVFVGLPDGTVEEIVPGEPHPASPRVPRGARTAPRQRYRKAR